MFEAHPAGLIRGIWRVSGPAVRRKAEVGEKYRLTSTFPSTPNGIRTRAAALKGRCPRPLDDGGGTAQRTLPSPPAEALKPPT